MAKNQKNNDVDQLEETVGEVIVNAEDFFQKYKNVIIYSLVGIAVIVGGYFGYTELISKPHQREAHAQMYRAEEYYALDSFNLALNGDGNALGFINIIDEYGSTDAGNLARFNAGVCYYKLANYNEAITQLSKFKANDEILAARALCVIGDSYVELNDLDNAAKYFVRAANHNDNAYTPIYLMKAGKVYESQNNFKEALSLYERIKSDYPRSTESQDIDKYIERANMLASK